MKLMSISKMDDVEMQGPEDEPAKAKKASAGKKKV